MASNAYDDVPYRSLPIEWTAPERLALASYLHGGPRPSLERFRVLELGCGDGANILPLAYYRPMGEFTGVDGAEKAIARAEHRRDQLGLGNLTLIHASFEDAAARLQDLQDQFDFIIVHGVFSWVPDETRDALFALCRDCVRAGGLLYLNYNAKPGWNVRGLLREYLLAATAHAGGLATRAEVARELASRVAASIDAENEAPYLRLLQKELRFVCQGHPSYIAHEFLAPHNRAYWRWDFLEIAKRHGFEHVADADFNYSSGRVPTTLPPSIADAVPSSRRLAEDTVDLLAYRQLHSPIFTSAPWVRRETDSPDLSALVIASRLELATPTSSETPIFRHPTGLEVEAKQPRVRMALEKLRPLWPEGLEVAKLFPEGGPILEDLRLLHRFGLIELRFAGFTTSDVSPHALNQYEREWGGYATTPYHTWEMIPVGSE